MLTFRTYGVNATLNLKNLYLNNIKSKILNVFYIVTSNLAKVYPTLTLNVDVRLTEFHTFYLDFNNDATFDR